MQGEPRAVTWIGMGLMLAGLLGLGIAIDGLAPKLAPEEAWVGQSLLVCFGGAAIMLAFGTLATFVNWSTWEMGQRDMERMQRETITPRLAELQAAAALSPEQARLVPAMEFQAHLVMTTADQGPMYSLECPGGLVPYEWAVDYLKDCGQWDLREIRSYPDGTHGRMYARMVTDWAIQKHLALPSVGNHPARWVTEHSKARALQLVGVEGPLE